MISENPRKPTVASGPLGQPIAKSPNMRRSERAEVAEFISTLSPGLTIAGINLAVMEQKIYRAGQGCCDMTLRRISEEAGYVAMSQREKSRRIREEGLLDYDVPLTPLEGSHAAASIVLNKAALELKEWQEEETGKLNVWKSAKTVKWNEALREMQEDVRQLRAAHECLRDELWESVKALDQNLGHTRKGSAVLVEGINMNFERVVTRLEALEGSESAELKSL